MHVEIQVALNFFISFLYNKLPRRRVNQFGEELEKALKHKFEGHWYPEKPFKGSAFRCIKTAPPLDPVFEVAAHESGMDLSDIQENLPEELSIWIDPGEVSYRLGEKGCVKILYSESESSEDRADREIYRTFNPEAQCFKPIDSVTSQLGSLSLSSGSSSSSPFGNSPSPTYKSSATSPINGFIPKVTTPLTFTTATFAQTKFGSTKLKTNGKRSHRMSPTEFSSYIKQRAILQQQQQQQQQLGVSSHHHPSSAATAAAMFAAAAAAAANAPQRPRSLSPSPPPTVSQQQPQQQTQQQLDTSSFLLLASASQQPQPQSQQQQSQPPQQYAPALTQSHFSPQATRGYATVPSSGVGGIFENVNGYLTDLFAPSPTGMNAVTVNSNSKVSHQHHHHHSQQQQQQQPRPVATNMAAANANALSLFFDNKSIIGNGGGGNAASSVGGLNMTFNLSGDSAAAANNKAYNNLDGVNFNVGAMSYPNQHLLMAN